MEPFVMLCKVVQTLYVLAWNPKFATIYMKATEQYSLSWGTLYYFVYGGSTFQGGLWICGWNPEV